MFGVGRVRAPEVKTPGVGQLVDDEVDLGRYAGDLDLHLAPVALQLLARWGLETHGSPPLAQGPFGLDVQPQHGYATGVAFGLDGPQDDNGVPHALGQ